MRRGSLTALSLVLAAAATVASVHRFRDTDVAGTSASVDLFHDAVEHVCLWLRTGLDGVLLLAQMLHLWVLLVVVPLTVAVPWRVYGHCALGVLATDAVSLVLYAPPKSFSASPEMAWSGCLVYWAPVLLHPGAPVVWQTLLANTSTHLGLPAVLWGMYLVSSVVFTFAVGRGSTWLLAVHLIVSWAVPPAAQFVVERAWPALERWKCVCKRGWYGQVARIDPHPPPLDVIELLPPHPRYPRVVASRVVDLPARAHHPPAPAVDPFAIGRDTVEELTEYAGGVSDDEQDHLQALNGFSEDEGDSAAGLFRDVPGW